MADQRSKTLPGTIIKAGLLAGALDISFALVQYYLKTGKDPANVLRFVASGIFGKAAFAGGNTMALYGLLFHFAIAFTWTILFFLLYPKIPFLKKNIIVTAVIYGLLVWLAMNRIVLPLSAAPSLPFNIKQALIAMLILMIAIGLPLSILAKRYYSTVNAR
ncbi:MAG: hypothetical protein ABI741_07095 [Ferruginibacter sp.]